MTRRACYWCAEPIETGEITCGRAECDKAARTDSCAHCGGLVRCAPDCTQALREEYPCGMPGDDP